MSAPRCPRRAQVAVAVAVAVSLFGAWLVVLSGLAPHRRSAQLPGDWPPHPAARALWEVRGER
eukprot:8389168-Pyramimonas_sp.AAC.1